MNTNNNTKTCCPNGALPRLEFDYEPIGEHIVLDGTEKKPFPCKTYITGEKSAATSWKGKQVIIMCSDAFGPFSGMHRKLADELVAQMGDGIVLLPDPWEGTGGMCPAYEDEDNKPNKLGINIFTLRALKAIFWDGNAYIKKFPWKSSGRLLFTEQLIPFLKTKGVDKFALMGFCYGCWMVLQACNDKEIVEHITCGIHFHPSTGPVEATLGGDDIALCKNCAKPQMIHATKEESESWKPDGAAHKALEANSDVPTVDFTLAPSSQKHGFMTRADTSITEDREAVKEGLEKALNFLKMHNS